MEKCFCCGEELFAGENIFRTKDHHRIVCAECMEQKKVKRNKLFPVTRTPNQYWTKYCRKYGYEP